MLHPPFPVSPHLTLLALAALILGPPAASAIAAIASSLAMPDVDLASFARGLAAAAIIATLATLLAWPAALALRRAWPLLALALLWPSFLAYAGWGVLRGPNTALGNLLATNNLTAVASHVQAIVGLALFVWPLAALIIALRTSRLDPATLESLRLDARSWRARQIELAKLTLPAAAAAWLVVAALMLGSAVPLHLAQLDTTAIALWRQLDQTPPARHGEVWLAATPLLVIAAGVAALLTRWLTAPSEAAPPPPRSRRASRYLFALLTLSALGPVALLTTVLGSPHTLITVIHLSLEPLAASLGVAAAVAAITLVLALLSWHLARARLVSITLLAFLIAAFIPGVLLGSATARAWSHLAQWIPPAALITDTWLATILGQSARLGFLGIAAGVILARSEPRDLTDLRTLDRATSFGGFLRAAALSQWPLLLAVAASAATLSLHEIEATIMLEPPTRSGGSFARLTLQHLHYSRTAEMAASVLILFGLGLTLLLPVAVVRFVFGSPRKTSSEIANT